MQFAFFQARNAIQPPHPERMGAIGKKKRGKVEKGEGCGFLCVRGCEEAAYVNGFCFCLGTHIHIHVQTPNCLLSFASFWFANMQPKRAHTYQAREAFIIRTSMFPGKKRKRGKKRQSGNMRVIFEHT